MGRRQKAGGRRALSVCSKLVQVDASGRSTEKTAVFTPTIFLSQQAAPTLPLEPPPPPPLKMQIR